MRKPIVVVGSINLDLVATADHVPLPGETIIGKDFHTFHGGKGANQAVGVAKLGYPVGMLGNVGDDDFGAALKTALRQAGVAVNSVRTVKGSSGVALINIGSDGQNNIVVVPGANGKLLPKDIAAHSALLRKAGMILAQLEIPLITLETVAAFAHRHKIPLMLDPDPARELPSGLLQVVAWITPNESETRILCGLPPTEPVTPATAARCANLLLERGPKNVVIKMGAQGAFLATADGLREMIPSFHAHRPRSNKISNLAKIIAHCTFGSVVNSGDGKAPSFNSLCRRSRLAFSKAVAASNSFCASSAFPNRIKICPFKL